MLIWKTLHILSMVTMVTAFIGAEVFYAAAMRKRDVTALAFVHRTVERTGLGFVALGGLVAGVVFGVLTALTGGFDLVAGWLIVAYVLVGAFLVNAALIGARVVHIAKEAVEADEGKRPAEEVIGAMASSRAVFLVVVNAIIFLAVIADMALKPSF